MERSNEKPIELTTKELDTVSGGTTTLPRNPFPRPIGPGPTFPKYPIQY